MVEHGDLRFKQHVRDLYNIPILSLSIYILHMWMNAHLKKKSPNGRDGCITCMHTYIDTGLSDTQNAMVYHHVPH